MKKIILFIILLYFIFNSYGCQIVVKDVIVSSNYAQFNYDEMKQEAIFIGKVEVLDNLSKKNSNVVYDGNTVIDFYSERKVKVLEVYKTDININKGELKFLEHTAITHKNEYIHSENSEAMKKGEKLIVFLCKSNVKDIPILMCGERSKIALKDINKNTNLEIAYKTAIEFESDENSNHDLKKQLLQSQNGNTIRDYEPSKLKKYEIETNLGKLFVQEYVDTNETYFEINGVPFTLVNK
ncbi:hypothetical protein RBG61_02425 [Paludicola sp. MB14-C6]|uniref:hypothetical protein n=1 Tax=Paludihabitans sp. MB14-C6 TaxID=3070656 RepID=UPI0027DE473C|nr:hypothetical protein [Paludicola sp. MB14-C6]WMJ23548.1 hypothetical protein RBG61_02425 [Paludicola sp. MB14-C6]